MLNLPEHLCLFFIDAASFLSVCGVYLALKSSTSLPVYSKEFVKDDAAYMVPFQPPTITPGIMSILSHVIPIVFIVALCILRTLQKDGFNTGLKTVVPTQKLGQLQIHPPVMAGIFYTGYFFYGACLMAILNKGIAHMVGKLSPNFLAVCKPNYTDTAIVFTREICTGNEEDILKACLSFPAEYASHLCFGFFFNTSIVFCIPQLKKVPMTRLLCLFVLMTLPILLSLSRFTDGFNHILDVFVGISIGLTSSAFIVLYSLRLFGLLKSSEVDMKHPENPSQTANITFDQLSSLPYTDLQVEMDEQ